MHKNGCKCPGCCAGSFEVLPFLGQQGETPAGQAGPFSEAEETELAMELLSVSSEAELDQFLGKMFKGVWKGIKKVAKPLGGVLKAVAKKALPFVGGALGSFIPIPGVGTALGSALGGALSKALEVEFEGMEYEQQELEMARRFVRIAGSAAQLAANSDGGAPSVQAAVLQSVRRHAPQLALPVAARWRQRRVLRRVGAWDDWA